MVEIEVKKTYKLSLDEQQLSQLYGLLLRKDNDGTLQYDPALIPVLKELRKLFPVANTPEPKEDNLPYFVGN